MAETKEHSHDIILRENASQYGTQATSWRALRSNRRLMNLFVVALVVAFAGSTVLVFQRVSTAPSQQHPTSASASQAAAYQQALKEGVDLGGTPAPDFTLSDQNGNSVTLSQLHGHPVVLTFFDSVCPHADCSLIAQYVNWTARDMGAKSANVSWVALSVNPWHDTPTTAKAFLTSRQVTIPMHYLMGSFGQLSPLWQDYHMQAELQSNGIVVHTTGVYVIDSQGHERMFFNEGFDPSALSAYVQHLITTSGSTAASNTSPNTSPKGSVTLSKNVGGETIDLTATPSSYGSYTFTVTAQDTQGVPIQGAQVTLDLTMPTMAMSPLHVTVPPMDPPVPGSYQARGVLSMIGQWQSQVSVLAPGASHPVQATFTFNAAY